MSVHRRYLLVLAALFVGIAMSGCSGDESNVNPGDKLPGSDVDPETLPGLGHVHGLGTNPADGTLVIATHFGLWRLGDSGEPKRVGDAAHDFMGFAVVGKDHFIASGHPNSARELPPLMGLIESKDGGKSWESRSLLGDADFHALRATDDGTFGWNSSTTKVMSSDDRKEWSTAKAETMLLDFAVDPQDGTRMIGTIAKSRTDLRTQISTDGGNTWTELDGAPQLIRLAWIDPGTIWGFAPDGTVWQSDDDAQTWSKQGKAPGGPEAVEVTPDVITVAAAGVIAQSRDDAKTWNELYQYGT